MQFNIFLKTMTVQSAYQNAIRFAAEKHIGQTIPGTEISYVVHLSNVAMEIIIAAKNSEGFDLEFAVQVALLHDILEDTETTFDQLEQKFGVEIANAVLALTKSPDVTKEEKMFDSLNRIRQQRKEVWAVKLADRITNLQQPPNHWDSNKILNYKIQAKQILDYLEGGNEYLEGRLRNKISEYEKYCISKV